MFAHLLDAARVARGKWIGVLADPVAGVVPRCSSKKYGVGIKPESLENSFELFQLLFEGFVRNAEDGIDTHLHIVEFQQCWLVGCLYDG
jgi:hypothetical protein